MKTNLQAAIVAIVGLLALFFPPKPAEAQSQVWPTFPEKIDVSNPFAWMTPNQFPYPPVALPCDVPYQCFRDCLAARIDEIFRAINDAFVRWSAEAQAYCDAYEQARILYQTAGTSQDAAAAAQAATAAAFYFEQNTSGTGAPGTPEGSVWGDFYSAVGTADHNFIVCLQACCPRDDDDR